MIIFDNETRQFSVVEQKNEEAKTPKRISKTGRGMGRAVAIGGIGAGAGVWAAGKFYDENIKKGMTPAEAKAKALKRVHKNLAIGQAIGATVGASLAATLCPKGQKLKAIKDYGIRAAQKSAAQHIGANLGARKRINTKIYKTELEK